MHSPKAVAWVESVCGSEGQTFLYLKIEMNGLFAYQREIYPFHPYSPGYWPFIVDLWFVPSLLTPCQYSPPRYFFSASQESLLHPNSSLENPDIQVPCASLPPSFPSPLGPTHQSLLVRRIEGQKALRLPVLYPSPMCRLVHPSPELQLMPGHSRVKSFLSNKHPYIEIPGCFHPDILKVTSTRDTQKYTH